MTDWWTSAPLAPANDPSFTGYIPGQPKPKEPKAPVFVPQGATQMFDPNTGTYAPVPLAPGATDKDLLKGAIEALGTPELLDSVARARDNLKTGWATGVWGALAEMKPGGGTPRDNFLGNLKAIQGSLIQDKLAALKELSKTGASGMGALSEKEGELLASSVAALTPDLSPDEYIKSFRQVAKHAKTLEAIRDGRDPRAPEVAKDIEKQIDAMFPADLLGGQKAVAPAAAPSGGGGDTPPGISNLTPEQSQAYTAFVAANDGKPSAPALKTFLEKLTGQKVTNADEIAAAIGKGAAPNPATQDVTLQQQIDAAVQQEKELGIEQNPAETLAVQGGTLGLSDEAAGVGNALANVLTSPFTAAPFDPVRAYQVGRGAERQRIQNARDQLGYGGTAVEFTGSLASGNPVGALATLAPREAAMIAGKGGAAAGALGGFGYGEGAGESATGAGVGALGGYALGRYAPAAVERILPRRFRAPQGMAPDLARASEQEGVDLIRPMVDPESRAEFGALESNVYSQPVIRGAQARVQGQIEDRAIALGGGGTAMEPGAAGDVVQTAGNRFINRSRGIKNRLYDRAERLGGNTAVDAKEAVAQIDNELAQLNEAPDTNAGEIAFLSGLKNDLSRPQTVGSIRRIRTSLRGQINSANLTATSAEARALRVMDAARSDIQRDAPAAAATAYSRADAFNRERQVYIDNVLKRFLGKRDEPLDSGKTFDRLKSMASPGGDGRKLAAMMRSLEPDERQDIAATIAENLGRAAPDMPFELGRFLSQTAKLSPSARRTIFGPDGAQSIENLRQLTKALQESGQDINRSRSATVLERQGVRQVARSIIASLAGIGGAGVTAAAGGGGTGAAAGGIAGLTVAGAAMGASAARRILSARAMVNPRVSRWLAEAANVSTPKQAQEAVRRLGVIITREPALAQELQPIYGALQQRLSAPVTLPLAAEPGGEGNNEQ